ncbi:MAG: methylenetetrahydrofolate--tRNA-(uracil(54)-C(5))-methyltransferase (FADH(2)-oxidizing) TrmFO [Chloroflexi bacterium]|nr:methylenetetrahydrofolate--tRNA-(uracil(54)-C(5))-methyltransferase (FADH(2)-oxidizing) TrmFO [Chloroflexota bacterium]
MNESSKSYLNQSGQYIMENIIVVGGGLAGSEAAWQIAQHGIKVTLYEMRPSISTGAHQTNQLAELVCSNSLGSNLPDRASGLLKAELRQMGSLLLEVAEQTALPAGAALAVDRSLFSAKVTERIEAHPNIEVIRQEMSQLPDGPVVIASGPLTSSNLSESIARFSGQEHLYFFDAISPIIAVDSIDMNIAYRASRWNDGEEVDGDYINCPFHEKNDYKVFVEALRTAERIKLHEFELVIEQGVTAGSDQFFEGCLPVEIIAERGEKSLAFGPLRPIGLVDPRVPRQPYAVVQLRQDNLAGSLYNMVGFQTNLTFPEQRRVFRTIPGLANADFVRHGQMHRNTFIASPKLLRPTMQSNQRDNLFFAGQITGVEGYMGNIASGLLAGRNIARFIQGKPLMELPSETMVGALCQYITHAEMKNFQPMKANFGILPPLENIPLKNNKRNRAELYSARAQKTLQIFLENNEN